MVIKIRNHRDGKLVFGVIGNKGSPQLGWCMWSGRGGANTENRTMENDIDFWTNVVRGSGVVRLERWRRCAHRGACTRAGMPARVKDVGAGPGVVTERGQRERKSETEVKKGGGGLRSPPGLPIRPLSPPPPAASPR